MTESEEGALPNLTLRSATPAFGKNRDCRPEGMKVVLNCAHSVKCCVSKFQGSKYTNQRSLAFRVGHLFIKRYREKTRKKYSMHFY